MKKVLIAQVGGGLMVYPLNRGEIAQAIIRDTQAKNLMQFYESLLQ